MSATDPPRTGSSPRNARESIPTSRPPRGAESSQPPSNPSSPAPAKSLPPQNGLLVRQNGEVDGPMTLQQLLGAIALGTIDQQCEVRWLAADDWMPIMEVPNLAEILTKQVKIQPSDRPFKFKPKKPPPPPRPPGKS